MVHFTPFLSRRPLADYADKTGQSERPRIAAILGNNEPRPE